MIMTSGIVVWGLDEKLAGHSEMQTQTAPLENKQHLFALGLYAAETATLQSTPERSRISRPVNARLLPAKNFDDTMTESGAHWPEYHFTSANSGIRRTYTPVENF